MDESEDKHAKSEEKWFATGLIAVNDAWLKLKANHGHFHLQRLCFNLYELAEHVELVDVVAAGHV